jgi:hypothetical protein
MFPRMDPRIDFEGSSYHGDSLCSEHILADKNCRDRLCN